MRDNFLVTLRLSTLLLVFMVGCGDGEYVPEDLVGGSDSDTPKGTDSDTPEGTDPPDDGKDTGPDDTGSTTACPEGATFVDTHGQLKVEGEYLKNSCGEKVRLKGVSSMWLNWETNGYAENREAMKWMIDNWHIKVIRAAMGVDESGGYLSSPDHAKEQVSNIVENAIALGIYVLIDWHSSNATEGTQPQEAIDFFTEMAQKYGDEPNVLYETFNEPLQIDWATEVKPYHEAVVAAIRAVDPDNIIILGTPQWDQRLGDAAADPVAGTNLMYTLHFYSGSHGQDIMNIAWDAFFRRLPIFVTEWGATTSDGGTSDHSVYEDEAEDWHQYLDDMNASWIAWKLDGCPDTSCLFESGAPEEGGWDDYLQGHGPYVVRKLLEK